MCVSSAGQYVSAGGMETQAGGTDRKTKDLDGMRVYAGVGGLSCALCPGAQHFPITWVSRIEKREVVL